MSTPTNPAPKEHESQDDKAASDSPSYPPAETDSQRKVYILVVVEQYTGNPVNEDGDLTHSQRTLFVRKVLGTVALQLFACISFIAFCMLEQNTRNFVAGPKGQFIAIICSIVWFGLFIAIACFRPGHGKPNAVNITLMILSTVLLSVYSAAYVIHFELVQIAIAAWATLGAVLILALITLHSQFDIRGYIGYIFMTCIALLICMLSLSLLTLFGVIQLSTKADFMLSIVNSGVVIMFLAMMILYTMKELAVVGGGGGKQRYEEDDSEVGLKHNPFLRHARTFTGIAQPGKVQGS